MRKYQRSKIKIAEVPPGGNDVLHFYILHFDFCFFFGSLIDE